MYIVFLIALLATFFTLSGHRTIGIGLTALTIVAIGALLAHHMTSKLPISL